MKGGDWRGRGCIVVCRVGGEGGKGGKRGLAITHRLGGCTAAALE